MPVIKKIIMQKRTPDQIMLIAPDPEFLIDQKAVARYIYNVIMHCHISVLNMPSGSLEVF